MVQEVTQAEFLDISRIVEENGKTWKENRLAIQHKYPLGALVEVQYDDWHDGGACEKVHARLFVVRHTRDCDGSPLYHLATAPVTQWQLFKPEEVFMRGPGYTLMNWLAAKGFHGIKLNLGEDSLTPVEVTDDVLRGVGALHWDAVIALPAEPVALPAEV